MTDLERPTAWKSGYAGAREFDYEVPNPYPPHSLEFYAWAAGYKEGIESRLRPGFLGRGYLYRDDCGEYWFYGLDNGMLRCLGDQATGEQGGDYFPEPEGARCFLRDGYIEGTIRTLTFDRAWGLLPTEDK